MMWGTVGLTDERFGALIVAVVLALVALGYLMGRR